MYLYSFKLHNLGHTYWYILEWLETENLNCVQVRDGETGSAMGAFGFDMYGWSAHIIPTSVWPKPGFDIRNQNQSPISALEPNYFLPKQNLVFQIFFNIFFLIQIFPTTLLLAPPNCLTFHRACYLYLCSFL